jgi:hypothetical protein
MVQFTPNSFEFEGIVRTLMPAADGWGAWAEILVEQAFGGDAALIGELIRVFVSPPLVSRASSGVRIRGRMTLRGGPNQSGYALLDVS